ncbi:hypothetical protein OJF2_47820 [Aquisphaera giovannonii]|uniref:Putative restriction endonuclease domain-containing protein n=1 Tax=Aquisphaera giovannonii TaxID=406548 RepID=A0A5B9W6D6_9BACT|nr:Uma2 family endonuclease [Aquisphaera giovannonii]QEH36222.1 hypothetical protein OJF2_47820 [Aquisphaera giovannonii]
MSVASQTKIKTKRYTPEDLLGMPGGERYELVDGGLVEQVIGTESSWIELYLAALLLFYCKEKDLGWVLPGTTGLQCFPDAPDRVRRPDVSFVRKGRYPGERLPKGFTPISPDLAVEIVSPRALAGELESKLLDYRQAGIPLIWVIYPDSRSAIVYRADGSTSVLREDDELSGEGVIPGFRCKLREIFQAREDADTAAEPGNGSRKPGGGRAKSGRRKPS